MPSEPAARRVIQSDDLDGHHLEWWREYGEWSWTCSCTPYVQAGYPSEAGAIGEARAHVER